MSFIRNVAGALALSVVGSAAFAQNAFVMVPAGPGGGWDTTGRQVMQAMNAAGVFSGNVQYECASSEHLGQMGL